LRHCYKLKEEQPNLDKEQPRFTPRKWLLLQVAQKNFSEMYKHTGENLFSVLTEALFDCSIDGVRKSIQALWTDLQNQLGFKVFPIILDEAQLLQHSLHGYFKSTTDPNKR
jgi:hypothetical protein